MKIIFFAKIREIIGKEEENIAFPENVRTVNDMLSFLKEYNKIYYNVFENYDFLIACDEELVDMDYNISKTKEIAIFPPVTGG
ncbi:MAG: MoaD/ThiS family protein [Rhizobiales bacterium TMED94]|nr:molybdopterin synthase sulfur carrier subunit [Rhodobiaceae bacterium]RPF86893.1 MAG: MoaD/ThiS family protein [Rhizobiales bacterium TMED94]|tara:strand:+ start:257 stop:505 length:249 start_codon:yes stop_codon:yes gene_type:complete